MRTEGLPRWLVYAVVAVLVAGVAGAGFLHVLSLTEERSTTTQGTHNITEDSEEGVVEIEVDEIVVVRKTVVDTGIPLVGEVVTKKEETEYDRLNVTTVEGGGTGEFLDGYETGDTVTLEATDEPEWQEEGTGEYAADGDEIRLIVISPSGERSVFEAHRTTEPSSKILRNLNSAST
jgi:hypothetical protein